MKKRLFTRLLSFALAITILSSDITAFAATDSSQLVSENVTEEILTQEEPLEEGIDGEDLGSENPIVETPATDATSEEPKNDTLEQDDPIVEDTVKDDEIIPEEPVYEPYWEEPSFSNLVLFVDFADIELENKDSVGYKDIFAEIRDYLFELSKEKFMLENILPQMNAETEEIESIILEKTAEDYAEDESALLEEVINYVDESDLLLKNTNLHYGNEEAVVDSLTIVVPDALQDEKSLFETHFGEYEGERRIGDDAVAFYQIINEKDLFEEDATKNLAKNFEGVSEDIEFPVEPEENQDEIPEEEIQEETPAEESLPEIQEEAKAGLQTISGKTYFIDENGDILNGYILYDEKKYYANSDGVLQSGWVRIGSVWHYFDEKGEFFEIPSTTIDGYLYCLENGEVSYFDKKTSLVKNSWMTISGKKYYFDEDGFAVKGWYQDGSYWYYADENGCMVTGETVINEKTYYFDSTFHLSTGWKKINGIYRYFDAKEDHEACYEIKIIDGTTSWVTLEDGRRSYIDAKNGALTGWRSVGAYRYHLNSEGFVDTGFFQDGRNHYYGETKETATEFSPIGNVVKGIKVIEGKTYGFHSSQYYRLTGWQTLDGKRYFFNDECIAHVGWYQEGSYWYYADKDGAMAKGVTEIEGKTYYFDGNYRLSTGWKKIDNIWRYFNKAESYLEQYELNYINDNETIGWITFIDSGQRCYLNTKNGVLTGWQTIENRRYYFDTNGILQTGWMEIGEKKYYAEPSTKDGVLVGTIASGMKKIEDNIYVFHSSQYYMLTGWQTVNNQRYFAKEDGKVVMNAWYQEGDYWYYADANGCMSKGRVQIGEKWYFFDNNYRLSTGWKRIGNVMHFFDSVAENPNNCHELVFTDTVNTWIKIDESRKSFINSKYQVLTGWHTIDGQRYYFDGVGVAQTGLFQIGRNYYYGDSEGIIAKGAVVIEGKVYGFHTSQYYGLTGWQTLDGKRYFFKDDSSASIGWYQEGDYWYYANDDGSMAKGVTKIGDQTYYFDGNYRLATGWYKINNVWHFFKNAEIHTDRVELSYQFDEAEATSGWITLYDGGQTGRCYIHARNGISKGWQTIEGQRYYFDSVGVAQTDWFEISGKKYYGELLAGTVVKGPKKIDEDIYVFHPSQYYMLTGWQTVDGQRYYIDADGRALVNVWYQEGDYWYYADTNGCMAKGRVQIGEKWYFFDNNYRLSTGWKRIGNALYFFDLVTENPENCCELASTDVVNTWVQIDASRKSYINSNYQVLIGWQTIDKQRYYFDSNGVAQTGLFQIGRNYYYADSDGIIAKNAKIIDEKVYGFHPTNYNRLTGWQTLDGKRYFFQDDCTAIEGWYWDGNYWYYAQPRENEIDNPLQGSMAKGETVIGDQTYFFDDSYRLITGWKRIGNTMYYLQKDSKNPMAPYIAATCENVGDWVTFADGRKSFINSKYQVLTGWQTIEKQRFYFDNTGILQTGWFQIGSNWYYGEPVGVNEGVVVKGLQNIDGKIYLFHTQNYNRMTGWQTVNGQRYYFDNEEGCALTSAWYQEGDYWYHADENGCMAKGRVQIGENWYYFDNNYRLSTGWKRIGNTMYFYESVAENPGKCWESASTDTVNIWVQIDASRKSYINSNYQVLTGWQTISGNRYYFDSVGIAQTGLFQIGRNYYYADTDGIIAKNAKIIDEKVYGFHPTNYNRLTGWQTLAGKRYFFKDDCTALEGWYQEGDYWYYAQKKENATEEWTQGSFAKGIVTIEGKQYYFDNNYRLATGWYKLNNVWHFFKNAETATGRFELIYHFDETEATSGWITLYDGEETSRCYIHAKNGILKGWQTIDKQRYYFDSIGIAQTGWFEAGGKKYYGEPKTTENVLKGAIAAGEKHIEGVVYVFHPSQYYLLTGWQTVNGQRYYVAGNGEAIVNEWYQEGDYWYHADDNGHMAKGRVQVGENWYYFDNNYRLSTGWKRIGNAMHFFENVAEAPEKCCEMASTVKAGDWILFTDGRKSYINTKYQVLTGWQTIDKQRYYFDSTGIVKTGWFQVGRNVYYADAEGIVAKGIKEIDGKIYGFHTSQYYRLTGWQTIDGKRYFFKDDCTAIVNEWYQEGNYWYYADVNGCMTKGEIEVQGKIYYFDGNYRLITGWVKIDNVWRYFEKSDNHLECFEKIYDGDTVGWMTFQDGKRSYIHSRNGILKGWQTIEGQRYYFDGLGIMLNDWFPVGNNWYYAEENGVVQKGFYSIDGETYYFHASSYYRMSGLQTINKQRYYFDADGIMQTGWFKVDNYWYHADETGKIVKTFNENSGWKTVSGKRYYYNAQDVMQTGWFEVANYYYYANSDGSVVKDFVTLPYGETGQRTYYFDGNYRLQTGWKKIDGKMYFFENAEKPEDCYLTNTKLLVTTGWMYLENGQICYANSKGTILTGWQTIDKQRYYFDANGVLQIGWFKVGNNLYYGEETGTEKGAVAKGIKCIDGETYCFHTSSYYLLKGWQTISGQRFYLDKEGKAAKDWFEVDGRTYYAETNTNDGIYAGAVVKGPKEIDGEIYFFHTSQYYMLTGFQSYGGNRYYLQKDGKARTNWFSVGTDLYYGKLTTNADGSILKGTLAKGAKEIDGETYFFHSSSNYRLTDWQTINGQRYYLDSDGTARTGWFTINNKLYYGEPSTNADGSVLEGTLAKGAKEIDGNIFVFHTGSYYRLTGWQTVSNQRYYLNSDGKSKIGWFTVGNYHYYANPNGAITKGLAELPYGIEGEKKLYYFDGNYRLLTGWQTINGKRYFFEKAENPEECYATEIALIMKAGWIIREDGSINYMNSRGAILTGWQTIDKQRFYFDSDGKLETGWFTVSGRTYYAEERTHDGILIGTVSKGAKAISKTVGEQLITETYFFHSSQYYMLTGFQSYGGQRYYLQKDGTAKTGWFTIGTDYYYGELQTSEDGSILKGTLAKGPKEIEEKMYFFHTSSNYRLTGWQTFNGQRYYLDTDGTAKTGWFTIGGKIYYGEPQARDDGSVLRGILAKGMKKIDGKIYTFHTSNYYRLTGWQTVDKERYYLNTDGTAKTGWFIISGRTYYGDPITGIVAKGAKEIDGVTYFFHSSQYYMLTGFQSYDGQRCYLQKDGTAKIGWFTVGTDLYYGEPDISENGNVLKGTLAKGAKYIDGKTYFFHASSNYRLTGWQTLNGQRYYLDSDGTARTGWFTVSNKIYYGEPENTELVLMGTLAKGVKIIADKIYAFHTGNYYRLTGWQTIDKQRYYFNVDGTAKTGWFKIGNDHYYAKQDGVIVKGLTELPYGTEGQFKYYYFDGNYRLLTGWHTINGKRYFFEKAESPEDCYATEIALTVATGWIIRDDGTISYMNNRGVILTGWQTINKQRFYFDSDGRLETGWFTVSGRTYYAEETTHDEILIGTVAKGAKAISKTVGEQLITETYFFHSSQYYMLTGFQSYGGQRYYLQKDGTAKTGWFVIGTDRYYGELAASEDGKILKGTLAKGPKEIDGVTYFFHSSSNYRLTGWQSYNGQRYYLETDGTAKTGWFTVGGKIYYGESVSNEDGSVLKGTLAANTKEINGKVYGFHPSSNYRLTGWQTLDKQRYYLNQDGTVRTGFFTISGKTYYGEERAKEESIQSVPEGVVAKGIKYIGKETYYFHTSQYHLLKGWQTVNKQKYYFETSGKAVTGWYKEGNYWYYADENGCMSNAPIMIGEKYYYFDKNYHLQTGWKTVDGKKYFFEKAEKPEDCYAMNDGFEIHAGWMSLENGQISYSNSWGVVLTGWQTIEKQRYYFDEDGVLQIGFFTVGGKIYYGEEKAAEGKKQTIPIGVVAKGAKEIKNSTYVFHASQYYMLTGFQTYQGNRYYLQKNGIARTGWFTLGNDLYYGEPVTSPDGTILRGTLAKGAKVIGEVTYFFHNTSNYRLTGWQSFNNQRYYLDANGKARTGWFTLGGKVYYGEPVTSEDGSVLMGTLAKGVKEIDGDIYVFHTTSNHRLTGWQTVNGKRYYLKSNGKARTGWFKSVGYLYYGDLDGSLRKGLGNIEEKTYYFDDNCHLITGWRVINKVRYFFNVNINPRECYMLSSGPATSGWHTFEDGRKSYFDSRGNLLKGWQTISGKKYYFDTDGIMQTGWCTIGGVDYFFNMEGIYIPITVPIFTSISTNFYGTADVKWKVVTGAKNYTLEYSKDSLFPTWERTSILIDDVNVTEYHLDNLEAGETYYFRLRYSAWGGTEENPDIIYSRYSEAKRIVVHGEVTATSTSAVISEVEITNGSRDGGITVQFEASLNERLKSADDQYYIVQTESFGNAIDMAEPVENVDKAFEISTEIVIDAEDVDRSLMNKFALAIKKEDESYQVVSTPIGITNPEEISENKDSIFVGSSKKGLQGVAYAGIGTESVDAEDTRTKQALLNVNIDERINPSGNAVSYEYKGKTYQFSDFSDLKAAVQSFNQGYILNAGEDDQTYTPVAVTFCLLLRYNSKNSFLIDPAARSKGHRYYTLNVREEEARETLEAFFFYMGEVFGQSDCYVTNWVLGNEINSSRAWNYQGSLSKDDYVKSYASAFRLLYNGVKASKSGNHVFVSLDNGWTAAPDTYSGKSILDSFAAYAQKENSKMLWSIAYHAYSYPLTRVDFWNDNSNTTNRLSTKYISMKNLSVLTDYAAQLEEKYEKPDGSIRVVLSEQGYTAGGKTDAYAESQARALARAYYIAEFNDRVDAFIIRALQDDPDEMGGGLYLGLKTYQEVKRITFYTYKFMDSNFDEFQEKPLSSVSSSNRQKLRTAQEIVCETDWGSIIIGFNKHRFDNIY